MGGPDCVVWPRADQRALEAGSTPEPIRVLVVDDDPRVRTAIGRTLALENDLIVVAEVADAATALAESERTATFVALVDLALPEIKTGVDLVRELSERFGCKVVAMSISGGLREAALGAGAALFVEKDGDIEAVLNAVRIASTLGL